MGRDPRNHAFTLVEVLVVVVVISVLSATVTVAMARSTNEQRTVTTIQALSEVRSSIGLYRAIAVVEGRDPFPPLSAIADGSLIPSGLLPANPFNGLAGVVQASDLASASARATTPASVGWVYFAQSGSVPVAAFYANSDELTEETNPMTGAVLTANEL